MRSWEHHNWEEALMGHSTTTLRKTLVVFFYCRDGKGACCSHITEVESRFCRFGHTHIRASQLWHHFTEGLQVCFPVGLLKSKKKSLLESRCRRVTFPNPRVTRDWRQLCGEQWVVCSNSVFFHRFISMKSKLEPNRSYLRVIQTWTLNHWCILFAYVRCRSW